MDVATNDELGRLTYETYAEAVNHVSVNGDALWEWDDLPQRVVDAWVRAALAVKNRVAVEE